MQKAVFLLGGSGQIGVWLLPKLTGGGYQVFALSRHAQAAQANGAVQWMTEQTLQSGQSGCKVMISAGPLELALRCCPRLPDLERVIAFSSSSVLVKTESKNRAERVFIQNLLRLEDALDQYCTKQRIRLTILRPTLIYGSGMDRSLTLLARWMQRGRPVPVLAGANGLRQPVHAADLAQLCGDLLELDQQPHGRFVLAGGEQLAYREMLHRIAMAVGCTPRFIGLPQWLLSGLLRTVHSIGAWRGTHSEMFARQKHDLIFSDAAARQQLAWRPRVFQPQLADFLPADQTFN